MSNMLRVLANRSFWFHFHKKVHTIRKGHRLVDAKTERVFAQSVKAQLVWILLGDVNSSSAAESKTSPERRTLGPSFKENVRL